MNAFIILDETTGHYYRQRHGSAGWWSDKIIDARMFGTEKTAQQTIDRAGHHVTYPNRKPVVDMVDITLATIR